MPRLHQYRSRNACYVLTSIRGAVVTFQLTPEGEQKLRLAGFAPGSRFQRPILLDLYRTGDAYTHGTGPGDLGEPPAQLEIDFANDPDPETAFPARSDCASVDDLHLTLYAAPAGLAARLQCPKCRAKAATDGVDTSIPIALLSLTALKRLFVLKPVATRHDSVTRLQDPFQAEFESKWAALRKTRRASQPSLLNGACSNELNLGT
jgi:hypothetical protein